MKLIVCVLAAFAAAVSLAAPAAFADDLVPNRSVDGIGSRVVDNEPSCVVTYAVQTSRQISVREARCDSEWLETDAVAFALSRIEGEFGATLLAQAPIEIEFTFSETVIRRYRLQNHQT